MPEPITPGDKGGVAPSQLGTAGPRSYAAILDDVKDLATKADELLSQMCSLNVKFGDDLAKVATIIDPKVNAILYKSEGDPEVGEEGQSQPPPKTREELEARYIQMCEKLDEDEAQADQLAQEEGQGQDAASEQEQMQV